jgi:hypothetical protein
MRLVDDDPDRDPVPRKMFVMGEWRYFIDCHECGAKLSAESSEALWVLRKAHHFANHEQ